MLEIENETAASIQRAEAAIRRRHRILPLWTLGFGLVGALSLALIGAATPVWALFGLGTAFLLAFSAWGAWSGARKARQNWAQEVWAQLGNAPPPLMSNLSERARRVGKRIERIYEDDPGGTFFPLSQSVRLFDLYLHQQKREREIEARLKEIEAMSRKLAATARELGARASDDAEALRERSRLQSEAHALQAQRAEIEASCRRLEAVVEKIELEARERKLRGQIEAVARQTTQIRAQREAYEALPEDTGEWENQISHEIEVYRKLERETEAGLERG